MKLFKYLFLFALITAFTVSCDKGLDPINPGDPGTEEFAPELSITYPLDGKIVRSVDSVATVAFKFLASDDFELKSVVLLLDGTEIGNITSFTDYRRLDGTFTFNGLIDGEHTLAITATDKSDKSVSQTVNFLKITTAVYVPLEGEVLYFPFDGDYKDAIAEKELTVVGTPDFVNEGKVNLAYIGDSASYLTYPTEGIVSTQWSVAFWYKLNAKPVRGGIISISRGDIAENRPWGFRMFRENNGTTKQNIGVNFGNGTTETWMNPFITVDTASVWMHIAVTFTETSATIYVNGEVAMENTALTAPLDWTECTSMTIGSGAPNFIYWDHLSDRSLYDEMHFFTRTLTVEEIQSFYAVKK